MPVASFLRLAGVFIVAAYALLALPILPLDASTPPAGAAGVIARINSARAGDTIRVPAGMFFGDVRIHDGVRIVGAGRERSWIKGTVIYGSRCVVRDIKLGKALSSTRNGPGASYTLFERVRFTGGGESGVSWPDNSVLIIGSRYSCDHITFRSCVIERNVGKDPQFTRGFNNISLVVRAGVRVESILFERCTVASSPRMGLEAFVKDERGVTRGYRGITLRKCTFRAADAQTVDFSDQPQARGEDILIEGCTIQGGGVTRVRWGYGLCLEMPLRTVVRNNRFTRARMQSIMMTDRGSSSYTGPGTTITGNTFDLTTGVTNAGGDAICLRGDGNVFTDNVIRGFRGCCAVGLWGATGAKVTGNVFYLRDGAAIREHDGSRGNILTPNTVN
jgi:hypothetical protein